ncbi:hypothetical protein [Bacillus cereus]|uniref:Uncharacterized protein n=1 Tax=Bacillus cereus TaxID=1396 RepID=A0A9X7M1H6_BACCE|nr:hypothetical protein [Bacillus cereus]MCQ6288109.1 hypothetical protein [Bacillus cereus]MCQ6316526.1 hypothetical protein [Bacillus cereus]MCQ6327675.1 hypothetical protein [Bacillus cereus]MCQ6385153.1 hypothetical protein [Bacillus cereus]QDZ76711.1 hypothetical protein D0437_28180 [Bacillus cereus]
MLNIVGFAISLVIISTLLTVLMLTVLKKKWGHLFILISVLVIILLITFDMESLTETAEYIITPIQAGGSK